MPSADPDDLEPAPSSFFARHRVKIAVGLGMSALSVIIGGAHWLGAALGWWSAP